MEQVVLEAYPRDEVGKGPAHRLRERGLVPGVAYGLGRETVVVAVPRDELEASLHTSRGLNVLLDLRIEGIESAEEIATIIKEVQRHPVSRDPLSVDLQWISLKDTITVTVPIEIEGIAPGVEEEGGVVDQIMHEVEVECLPTSIPDYLIADITGLEINDTIHAEVLTAPEGIEILVDPGEAVVSIAPPISEEELEVRVPEELLEGLEEIPLELEEEELVLEEGEGEEGIEEGEEPPEEEPD